MTGGQVQAAPPADMERIERAYFDHVGSCSGCRAMLRRCPKGETLWRRYSAARART